MSHPPVLEQPTQHPAATTGTVQSLLFEALRPLARARGYRGTYPQYSRSLLSGPSA